MQKGKGELLVLVTAFISGLSVYINGFAVTGSDPFVFTTLKNILVSLFLVSTIILLKESGKLRRLTRGNWVQLATIGLVGGSVPFLLFFWGLSLTGGVVGSFLYRLMFIFAAMLAVSILKERFSAKAFAGACIAIAGNFVLLSGSHLTLGTGEILVLAATVLWACESIISKKALEDIEPRIVAFGRMFFGSAIMLAFLAFSNRLPVASAASPLQLGWAFITALFLYLYVHFWYNGLKLTTVTYATAALVLGSPVTTALNFILLGKAPTYAEAAGMLLLVLGITLLIGASSLARALKLAGEYITGAAWKT